jgi:Transcriptional regulators of sugar metabolism
LKLKRIKEIEKCIRENGTCSLEQLCNVFNVSANTIRRDINELAELGIVKKVYGGVVINDEHMDSDELNLTSNIVYSKDLESIAEKAAALVNDGDIILISSGTTAYRMIHYLKSKKNITIITNNLLIIFEALNYENIHLIAIGGDVLKNTNSIVGYEALNLLKKLNAHKVFLATSGLSVNTGLTNSSSLEAEIKQTMIKVSNQTIILADHSKFDVVSLYTFLDFKDVDVLITDKQPSKSYTECFIKNNVELIVAGENEG